MQLLATARASCSVSNRDSVDPGIDKPVNETSSAASLSIILRIQGLRIEGGMEVAEGMLTAVAAEDDDDDNGDDERTVSTEGSEPGVPRLAVAFDAESEEGEAEPGTTGEIGWEEGSIFELV